MLLTALLPSSPSATYTVQAHLPRGGTAHSELALPPSSNSQGKMLPLQPISWCQFLSCCTLFPDDSSLHQLAKANQHTRPLTCVGMAAGSPRVYRGKKGQHELLEWRGVEAVPFGTRVALQQKAAAVPVWLPRDIPGFSINFPEEAVQCSKQSVLARGSSARC